jgi:hypothetical protein
MPCIFLFEDIKTKMTSLITIYLGLLWNIYICWHCCTKLSLLLPGDSSCSNPEQQQTMNKV